MYGSSSNISEAGESTYSRNPFGMSSPDFEIKIVKKSAGFK